MRKYTLPTPSLLIKISTIIILLLCLYIPEANAQQNSWKYLTESDGIKVYSSEIAGSKIKALKVECTLNTTLSSLVKLLLDVPATTKWVYHTKSCSLVQQVSPSELFYYSEVSLPWPLENRDFVAHVKVTQDINSRIVTVNAPAIPGRIAVKKGVVRVSHSIGLWKITPLSNRQVKVEYSLQVDPGGIIPAWAVNALSSQGPIESFKNMKRMLLLPEYKNVRLSYIVD